MAYRKKALTYDALQFRDINNLDEIQNRLNLIGKGQIDRQYVDKHVGIPTQTGVILCPVGGWVVFASSGEVSVYTDSDFNALYESV